MQANLHYTYIHRRQSDGAIFYAGKGSKRRAWGAGNRSREWHQFLGDADLMVEIVATFHTAQEAFEAEKLLVAELRSAGHQLVNRTAGGAGSGGAGRGVPLSEKTKLKLRLAHLGKKQSPETIAKRVEKTRGRKMTPEQRARMREVAKKRNSAPEFRAKMSAAMTGRVLSADTRAKMSASLKGKNTGPRDDSFKKTCAEAQRSRARPVECVETGAVFRSQADVVEWLVSVGKPLAVQSNISSACLGRVKTAYGFRWRFHEESTTSTSI